MLVFLFTDIEGSTQLWELHGRAMADALLRHDAILSACIEDHGGQVVKHTGDGVFAVFDEGNPLACALSIQRQIDAEQWSTIGRLDVRVALHAGDAERRGDDYFGSAVNRTARLLGAAWGGQTLLSEAIVQSYTPPADAEFIDFGVHMLKDLGYPQRIYGLVLSDHAHRRFPPLRSLSTRIHNLPPQATPFVGRRKELAEVLERLEQPSCRLLTILGPGGVGKTRLSLQVAAELVDSFAHGVFQVPLAPLSTEKNILTTIADAVKYPFAGAENPERQLFSYLREKEMLVLLDNFEHLIAGSPLVGQLLEQAQRLKIIVTSRERLNLTEEWTYQLDGLPYPDAFISQHIERYSSVQLFLQHANRVLPTFAPDDDERADIVRIVRLVEGIPLGIELAAAWVRVLSCSEIAREIETSRDFLAATASNVPKRHHSLRAVFENSWKLLSSEEQQVLARLSVFRGGFDRGAAEEVAAADLKELLSLTDKSLVRRATGGRYELLETVRQFASEKLEKVLSSVIPARRAHAHYYLHLLHQQRNALKGTGQKAALGLLEPENENIRTAWRFALAQDNWSMVSQALEGLFQLHELRGSFQDGKELFDDAFEAHEREVTESDWLRPMLLSRRGWFTFRLGQYENARRDLKRSLEIARRDENLPETAFSLYNLGVIAYQLGNYARAVGHLQDSLRVWEAVADDYGKARTLSILGVVARERGDNESAQRHLDTSLTLHRKIGDRRGISRCLNMLALIQRDRGQSAEARKLLQESLAICREFDDRRDTAFACSILGAVLYESGEYDGARDYCQESLEIREEIGERRGMAFSLHDLGNIARALGRYESAWSYLHRSLSIAAEIRAVPLALYVISGIAELWENTGNITGALELVYFILQHPASFEMANDRAKKILDALHGQVSEEALQEAQLISSNSRFEELAAHLLSQDAS